MSTIDDIVYGVESDSNESTITASSANTSLSDTDLDDILHENGISLDSNTLVSDNETQVNSEETSNNDALYQEALNNATDEEENSHENEESEEEENTSNEANAKLPLNSPTLLVDESTSRFSGTEWYNEIQKARVIIAGIGGIGSNAVFQLARMVPANITMYDDDKVERVNMAGQLFSSLDIGKYKVDAIAEMIQNYTSMHHINAIRSKFTATTETGDIMICGFDSMKARKTFFNSWHDHIAGKNEKERSKCLFLDGRLSIDTLQIFCITGNDNYNINRYQSEFLFSDYQADVTVCSMKQTTYLACMIGSLMVNLFTNFIANTLNPIIPYDLPFFTEYDAQNMIFKTEN